MYSEIGCYLHNQLAKQQIAKHKSQFNELKQVPI